MNNIILVLRLKLMTTRVVTLDSLQLIDAALAVHFPNAWPSTNTLMHCAHILNTTSKGRQRGAARHTKETWWTYAEESRVHCR